MIQHPRASAPAPAAGAAAELAPFAAFFLSGASSLVFQMIWSRLLHHVFGSSSVAISSVVSVFMGGLALGAWLFGRYADRVRRPLLLYAAVELCVGAFALCVPLLVRPEGWLAAINAMLRQRFGSESLGFMLARFLCIVPLLIVPTTLMGATLPLLSRHFVQKEEHASGVSTRVGALYAVNTAGAVTGVFLAGFVLMPRIGVALTNAVAVSMNFALGLGIFALRSRLGERGAATGRQSCADAAAGPESATFPPGVRRAAAVSFALSGFCSLLYEVVWSRALINTIGGSVYAFALILMTFLVGIAAGSAGASACLAGERRRARALLLSSGALALLAPFPLGLRYGLLGWSLGCAACLFGIAGLEGLAGRRQREHDLLEAGQAGVGVGARSELAPLLVPLALAIGDAFYFRGRLEALVLSGLCMIALLFALLARLQARLPLLLACVQAFIGLATLASDFWADQISLTFAGMVAPFYHALGEHVDRVLGLMFTAAALCVVPSALGMGAMFPLTLRIASAGGARVGREVGAVYTGNTLGSIAGAWLPGFVLMPTFGMQPTLHCGIALNLALGALMLWSARGLSGSARVLGKLAPPLAVLAAALLYAAGTRPTPLSWNLSRMTLGVFRISLAKDVLDQETWGEPDLVFYKDGLSTTVSVERWGRHYSLKNNGKVEASNGNDMPTQIMVAALPLLLHQRGARGLDVAIIGLGSGVTVGAALQFPLRSLEVMELERSVAQASRFFADVNHLRYAGERFPFVNTPRLRLINDDGRNYLASTDHSYDVIVGEPSNPWLTGVSDLFTVDHYRLAKRRLRARGIYCEWIQLYEMSPENVKMLYRTFASQFSHVLVFSSEDLSSDTILLGSDAPLPLDLTRLRAAFEEPAVAAELERAYVHSPYDVLARILLADRQEVLHYTEVEERLERGRWVVSAASTNDGPCPRASCRRSQSGLNTDDNAAIEFAAPRDLIGFERYKGYLQTIYAESWPYGRLSARVEGLAKGPSASEDRAELALALLAHGRKREAARLLEQAAQGSGAAGPSLRLGRAMWDALKPDAEDPPLRFEPPAADAALGAHSMERTRSTHAEVLALLARGDPKAAKAAIQALPTSLVRSAGPSMRFLHGYVLYRAGDYDMALGEFEAIARGEPGFTLEHPELYYYLGRSHDALLHFDKAVRSIRAYVETALLVPPAAALPEPQAAAAPVSDRSGESDKVAKSDRGSGAPAVSRRLANAP